MTAPTQNSIAPRCASKLVFHPSLFLMICLAGWWFTALSPVQAAQVTDRSVALSTAIPSAAARHDFSFTLVSTTPIGSISFEYCENSPLPTEPCNIPSGLNVTNATLDSQTGNTGFTFDNSNTTINRIVITRAPVAASAVVSSYEFSNITNPSNGGTSQYVRISTHATVDGTGPETDYGSVAYATASPYNIGAVVPPFLVFCAAITVATDCSSSSGDQIDLGTLTKNSARFATSQFAGATNSLNGMGVYSLGVTLTSGNNIINNPTVPQPSFPGTSQFGINLRDNTVPNVGSNSDGPGTIVPLADYNGPNFFIFEPDGLIAASPIPTDFTRMTVSYITNISEDQEPGIYSTTITYLGLGQY